MLVLMMVRVWLLLDVLTVFAAGVAMVVVGVVLHFRLRLLHVHRDSAGKCVHRQIFS